MKKYIVLLVGAILWDVENGAFAIDPNDREDLNKSLSPYQKRANTTKERGHWDDETHIETFRDKVTHKVIKKAIYDRNLRKKVCEEYYDIETECKTLEVIFEPLTGDIKKETLYHQSGDASQALKVKSEFYYDVETEKRTYEVHFSDATAEYKTQEVYYDVEGRKKRFIIFCSTTGRKIKDIQYYSETGQLKQVDTYDLKTGDLKHSDVYDVKTAKVRKANIIIE